MEPTINDRRHALQGGLVASARLRGDGVVIYSQNGTPPTENKEFPLDLIKGQLECNGASSEKADKFVNDLRLCGHAEIREQGPLSSFSVL
jgi:hypothetical protein